MTGTVRFHALMLVAALLVACDSAGDADRPVRTPTPDASRFPIVLSSDTRVTASADGSGFTEDPLAPGQAYADPTAGGRVLVRDGEVVIEKRDGSGSPVSTGVSTDREWLDPVWAPDGARVVFDAAASGSPALYVVASDGSGLVDLGAGLEGDAFPLAWAPDSDRVAFGLYGGDASAAVSMLYTARADGSERAALGEFTHPQGDGGWDRPKFSPDGSKLVAFVFNAGLSLRIFDTAGGAPVDLGGTGVTKFSSSPDGRSIAFDTFDAATQHSSVLIADAVSGSTRTLTEGSWPRWSPAGDRVAFKRTVGDAQFQVRTIRPDGSDDVAVGPPGYYVFPDLVWSEDGLRLSFTRPAFGPAQLYRVFLAEGRAEAVGTALGEAGSPPQSVSLSPDGRAVAFLSNAFRPEGGWYVQDLVTRESTLLAAGGFPFAAVHWTPDGPVFATGGPALLVTDPGGANPRNLGLERVFKVSLSPDGSRIAAMTTDGLWIVATDGSGRRRIVETATSEIVQSVDWAPDGGRLTYSVTRSVTASGATITFAFASDLDGHRVELTPDSGYGGLPYWSPDGATLAQARSDAQGAARELWLMDADGEDVRMLAPVEAYCCDALYWSPDGSRIAVSSDLSTVSLIDVAAGGVTRAITTGGGCNVAIAGWAAAGDALYVYPACYFGI